MLKLIKIILKPQVVFKNKLFSIFYSDNRVTRVVTFKNASINYARQTFAVLLELFVKLTAHF